MVRILDQANTGGPIAAETLDLVSEETNPPVPAGKTATLQDVADRCGLSKTTVRRALHGEGRALRPATFERVRAAAAEIGYDPEVHFAARSMGLRRQGRTALNHTVAVFLPDDTLPDPYFFRMYQAICHTISQAEFDIISVLRTPQEDQARLPQNLLRGGADGVLLFHNRLRSSAILERLRAVPGFGARPVVTLVEAIPDCSSVCADDYDGGYALATHLLQLGHRRLLHFEADGYRAVEARIAGHRQACRDYGLDPDECLICAQPPGGERELLGVRLALLGALERHPDVTAIFARNDYVAPWIVDCLERWGLRVPEDLSLVGFDEVRPLLNDRRENILTTVSVPLREMGRQAAALLLDRIMGRATEDEHIVCPVSLVVRASTAPPRPGLLSH
ncbi:MAG TPA: LacI family DNA-binding transcriptional regulator [Armatimonadota bacterium]|jgi:LacI family transcriptional regulator